MMPARAATSVRSATAVGAPTRTAAMRAAHREVGSCEMRAAAVGSSTAMGRGHTAEPGTAVGCHAIVKARSAMARSAMERRPILEAGTAMGCGTAVECHAVTNSRCTVGDPSGMEWGDACVRCSTKPPGPAVNNPASRCGRPRHAAVRRNVECGNPGAIKARARRGIGIGDTATMGRVMPPYAA